MIWEFGDRSLDLAARVQVMGILNITPDSFYDGGRYQALSVAVDRASEMVDEGVDIIDVGGESTRPPMYGGGAALPMEEECARVVPVVEALRRHHHVTLSIDTTKAEVARRCLAVGADIINDTSAMRDDAEMSEVAASSGAAVVLMHRRGTIATMQNDTEYKDLVGEVKAFLVDRIQAAVDAGVDRQRLAIDPGLGFGKSVDGNLSLIRHLEAFANLGCPVLVGASRKSFISRSLGTTAEEALEGSLAVGVVSAIKGARILRVHDVAATVRTLRMTEAIWPQPEPAGAPC